MEKRVQEWFEQLNSALDRVREELDEVGHRIRDLAARQNKFEAALEVQNHAWDERFNQLWRSHSVLMDSQNTTWAAINQLTANIDRLMRRPGPNSHGE